MNNFFNKYSLCVFISIFSLDVFSCTTKSFVEIGSNNSIAQYKALILCDDEPYLDATEIKNIAEKQTYLEVRNTFGALLYSEIRVSGQDMDKSFNILTAGKVAINSITAKKNKAVWTVDVLLSVNKIETNEMLKVLTDIPSLNHKVEVAKNQYEALYDKWMDLRLEIHGSNISKEEQVSLREKYVKVENELNQYITDSPDYLSIDWEGLKDVDLFQREYILAKFELDVFFNSFAKGVAVTQPKLELSRSDKPNIVKTSFDFKWSIDQSELNFPDWINAEYSRNSSNSTYKNLIQDVLIISNKEHSYRELFKEEIDKRELELALVFVNNEDKYKPSIQNIGYRCSFKPLFQGTTKFNKKGHVGYITKVDSNSDYYCFLLSNHLFTPKGLDIFDYLVYADGRNFFSIDQLIKGTSRSSSLKKLSLHRTMFFKRDDMNALKHSKIAAIYR